jgi:hypothetical protein
VVFNRRNWVVPNRGNRAVGVLRGGAALLKRVAGVLGPVRRRMPEYYGVDPTTLTAPARSRWVEWSKTIPSLIEEARTLVVLLVRELYTRKNLDSAEARHAAGEGVHP